MKKLLTVTIITLFSLQISAQNATNLKKFVGTYTLQDDSPVSELIISINNGELYGIAAGQGEAVLKPSASPNEFEVTGYNELLTFSEENGIVTAVKVSIQGMELKGLRQFPAFTDYVGKFTFSDAPFQYIVISTENGSLLADAEGMGKAELAKTSILNEFTEPNYNSQIVFNRNEAGTVTSMSIFAQGQEMVGKKE